MIRQKIEVFALAVALVARDGLPRVEEERQSLVQRRSHRPWRIKVDLDRAIDSACECARKKVSLADGSGL